MTRLGNSHKSSASRCQEERLAAEGAPRTPGSGNGSHKGDNKGQTCLFECKTTQFSGWTMTVHVLEQLRQQAKAADRTPVLQVQFHHDHHHRYAVLRWEDFKAYLAEAGHPL